MALNVAKEVAALERMSVNDLCERYRDRHTWSRHASESNADHESEIASPRPARTTPKRSPNRARSRCVMPSYVPNNRIGAKLEESKGPVGKNERNRAIRLIVGCCWLIPTNALSRPERSSEFHYWMLIQLNAHLRHER